MIFSQSHMEEMQNLCNVTENPFISSRQQVTDPYLSEDDLPPTTQGGNIESSQVSENHFISLQRPLISPPQGFWTAFDESAPREAPIAPQAQSTIPSHPSSGLLAANEEADFRGLGKIRNEYIPLLEEAISQQPHLWSCQESRTKQCRRWAYSALGRVLHFLRNVKIKDLTAEKKAEFDKLWREMDLFNFDLTWLAIKQDEVMNAGVDEEMVMAEEEQKGKILSMELGINEMKWKLMEAEQELEKQRRVLADLERDQPNLDSVLNF
ncbi:Ubiquitin carboxyl-terminal hydrolase family protein [Quillaja saponaria]|uniref:Ubiquitin carboxyl-terminal hydrolase family protein n=1 Tax=Quillaja saponaria TaxID=32244 RepID=A0AAD7Q5K1_QUISA|nr:Ubiquitin carboxyl-terminal hydrolase family protein [Quillaja saponaria]